MRALVVGSGLAGLTAAYRLKQAGWDVRVLEAADDVGGRARTIRKAGYAIDIGASQASTGFRKYLELVGELGLTEQLYASSNTVCLMRNGRLYNIDGRRSLGTLLSPAFSLHSRFHLLKTCWDLLTMRPPMSVLNVSACHAYDVESARHYAERRLGREIYDVLIDPLIRAYVLRRADDISCLEWFSALRNLIGQRMLFLRGGADRLPRALAAHFDVELNAPVREVRRVDGGGVEVRYASASGEISVARADACVIATRLPEAAAICPDHALATTALLEKLKFSPAVVVSIGYSVLTRSKAIGVLVPAVENAQIALVWLNHNKVDDCAPNGHSLISVYLEGSALDALYDASDKTLTRLSAAFIEKLFPELRGQQTIVDVSRWKMGLPYTATGAYAAIHAFKEKLDPRDRIQFAGDYLTCTGQNSAVHYGELAARHLIEASGSGTL